jgi:predicted nucleotidyltransferase component of viral defense system
MNPSLERIETLAAGTGFQSQALEKVIRLGELAADIGRHPLLGRVLALKGGTALNLLLGAPARLSVDLDFNYRHDLAAPAVRLRAYPFRSGHREARSGTTGPDAAG